MDGSALYDACLDRNTPAELSSPQIVELVGRSEYLLSRYNASRAYMNNQGLNVGPEADDRLSEMDRVLVGPEQITTCMIEPMKGYHMGSLDLQGRHPDRYLHSLSFMRRLSVKLVGTMDHLLPTSEPDQILPTHAPRLVHILELIGELKRYLDTYPNPVFQSMFFLDLPMELLDLVLRFCDPDVARILRRVSKVCKQVAEPYAFRACIIPAPYVKSGQQTLSDACDNLTDRMTFIFGTPIIVQRLRELAVTAMAFSLQILEINPQISVAEIFSDIQSIMSPFIPRISLGTNVEILLLSALQIDSTVLEVVGALPRLRTLHLSQCNMDVGLSPSAMPSVRSFVVRQIDGYDIMEVENTSTELVKCFPCLLSYTHIGSLMAYNSISLADMRGSNLTFFSILECMHLINIPMEELSSIVDFLRASREHVGDKVSLAHFFLKISPIAYFDEMTSLRETRSLLTTMHLMPIRFLHLEGLNYVLPDFIDIIASSFPLLEHLTLMRQTSSLDERESLTQWSRTTLDYASHLAPFHRLQHFAFNYPFEHLECYPSIMPSFEDGFSQEAEDCLVEESWDCIFRVFVAYIPSLQTLNFLESTIFRRRGNGSVESMRYNRLDELRGDVNFAQALDPKCCDPRSMRKFQGK